MLRFCCYSLNDSFTGTGAIVSVTWNVVPFKICVPYHRKGSKIAARLHSFRIVLRNGSFQKRSFLLQEIAPNVAFCNVVTILVTRLVLYTPTKIIISCSVLQMSLFANIRPEGCENVMTLTHFRHNWSR